MHIFNCCFIKGGELLDLLQSAKKDLGKYDIRNVKGRQLIKEIHNFLSEAKKIDQKQKNGEKMKSLINLTKMASDLLAMKLEEEWNTQLKRKTDEEERQEAEMKPVLKKVSPIKNKFEILCSRCGDKKYSNAEAYNRHLVKAHDAASEQIPVPKVTCYLTKEDGTRCNAHQPLPMTRHLETHKISRPKDKDMQLRFYKSTDGGKSFTDVVFLHRNAEDPAPDTYINFEDLPEVSASSIEAATNNMDSNENNAGSEDNGNKEFAISAPESEMMEDDEVDHRDYELVDDNNEMENDISRSYLESLKSGNEEENDNNNSVLDNEDVEPEKEKQSSKSALEDENDNVKILELQDLDDNCSDINEDDEEDWSQKLKENRLERYLKRNIGVTKPEALHEKTGNREFIEEFHTFMKDLKQAGNSTIGKACSWLFYYPNSFLKFETNNNNDFLLNRLLAFADEERLLEVSLPIEWQQSEAGTSGQDNPSPRKEMMKAHGALRDFLLYKLEAASLGTSAESLIRKDRIRTNILNVETMISRLKIHPKLNKQVRNELKDKIDMQEISNPNQVFLEINAVKHFFASNKYRELYDKKIEVWRKALADNAISKADFVDFGHFARFILGKKS